MPNGLLIKINMKVLHIVSSLSKINFGIWNAAIYAAKTLNSKYEIEAELWVCNSSNAMTDKLPLPHFFFKPEQLSIKGFKQWLNNYSKTDTIIITHGAWLKPTKLGNFAAKNGFKWIFTPHGMFENYTIMENGRLIKYGLNKGLNRKWLYYVLYEKKLIKKASTIRAVSEVERKNLKILLNTKIELVYNGIPTINKSEINKSSNVQNVLFLARLQKKKGIIHLVRAWNETMAQNVKFKLIIGGPDEGELESIKPYFTDNIVYIGSVYGEAKTKLLQDAHYYILPSYSEGFPTSVVEGMGYGAIPIITVGCNFPEVFELNLGYKIYPEKESVKHILNTIADKEYDFELSKKNIEFIEENLTEKRIASDYYQLYRSVLNNN